ncbi:adenosylcobinamide-GDP ribazoletransferase [Devosia nitrariae]|uniref:Adenosylcobinamide-GDP ribazoletransferase n=1 Tax=Devosia nitrariae TaxID=2071872 RepID=A0ABQ5W572_9HYPH|nr:adenosylcobinamide-GDP ribazoletransferase [Devosia nitrariae]
MQLSEQTEPRLEPADGETDRPRAPESTGGLFADMIMALRFFSRLPTGDSPHEVPVLDRMALALPFASLVIGIGPALLLVFGLLLGLPAYFAAVLAVAAMVLATGAMAEDAIADSMDGLFGGGTRERRLEIMKDSRHGTYGVAALCLFILLRVTALGAIGGGNPLAAGGLWLAAGVLGRSAALWLPVMLPAARQTGAGATAGEVGWRSFSVGALFAAILAVVLAGPFAGYLGVLAALALLVAAVVGWTVICRRLVGGQTGDLTGGLTALCEIAALTAFLLFT